MYPPKECAICVDDRQYVPPSGQVWTSLEELSELNHTIEHEEVEPGLFKLWASPRVGIGQRGHVVRTDGGNLLWDPPGYLDEAAVEWLRGIGGVSAIVASPPHTYGAQVSWSRALDDAEVLVAEADQRWVQRVDGAIRTFSGDLAVLPGVTPASEPASELHQ